MVLEPVEVMAVTTIVWNDCPHCEARFSLQSSLDQHINAFHVDEKIMKVRIARTMPVQPVEMPPYGDATAMARIAELEKALNDCMEWAGSDCENEACAGVIEVARKALGVAIRD